MITVWLKCLLKAKFFNQQKLTDLKIDDWLKLIDKFKKKDF